MTQGEAQTDDRVMALVEEALALPAEERDLYLRSTCSLDSALYREVKERIDWEERMGGFLREPLLRYAGADPVFIPGELVSGRFRIVRALGRGGMGLVYEAADEKLNRRVALKCAQAGYQRLLNPEARAALEVSHPNVCKLHELHTAGTPDGPVDFLTMEFIDGHPLSQRIKEDGPVPPGELRGIAVQVCAGLEQVHRQGVVHGDMKPGNILLSRTPEGKPRAVITDFGIAHIPAPDGKGPAVRGGTPEFMSPELLKGEAATVASDLYALGVTFYAALTGRRLPKADDPQAGPPVEDLPAPWNRIVSRCLAAEPERRFRSAAEVANVLTRRRPVVRWLLAAAAILIAVLGFSLWRAYEFQGTPVRLAVLPVTVEGAPLPAAAGLAADLTARLTGVRSKFTVISPGDALRNQVDTVEKARSMLGATHVLRVRLNHSGARIFAQASLLDAASDHPLGQLRGDYSEDQTPVLAKALLATVTRAFSLKAGVPRETVSDAAYPHYVQAAALMLRDNQSADEAIPLFEKAIELDPNSALPYAGLAGAELQKFATTQDRKWLDLAGAHVGKAKSLNPDSAAVLVISGALQQRHGWYEQAIAEFQRATEIDPGNPEAWRSLAEAYENTNRAADAAATYRKAIETQPGYFRHYVSFGNFYLFRNQFREAEEQYRRVTEIAPRLASGHMNLGLALLQQGKYQEAETSLLAALSLRKTPRLLMNIGALYFHQERFEESVRYFEEAVAAGPVSAIAHLDLGDAYRQMGRSKEAAEAYRRAGTEAETNVGRNPRDGYARSVLALASARLGDARRAEIEIAQALASAPENAMVMREAVMTYEALGRREQSLEVLRRAPRFTIDDLSRHPDVKPLRQDPAFQSLLSNSAPE